MRRLLLLLALTAVVWSQAAVKRVTFLCEPHDAEVYLQISGARPYLLGAANQPLLLDMSLFAGRRQVTLTFQRRGWLPQTVTLQQQGQLSRYFDTRDRYPEAGQGPIRLTAAPGRLGSRMAYYSSRYRGWLALALLLAGLFATGLGKLRQQARLGQALQELVSARPVATDLTGRRCGTYRLVAKIGQGGMATVYRALPEGSLDPGAAVAVKVLSERGAGPEERKRFLREVRICAELRHPSIVSLQDWGEEDDTPYLVMELLTGETLRSLLKREGPLSPRQAMELLGPAFEALAYAHEQGVVHRDVKPDNLFLTAQGVKVMDFGVARGDAYTVATATGQALGTPAYMAPEQIHGQVNPASDQYALGAVLYEMLTGRPPFLDPDPFRVAFMQVWDSPEPPSSLRADLPSWVDPVLLRMLAKTPAERFPSLREAAAQLRREAGLP